MLGAFGGEIAPRETEAIESAEASLGSLLIGTGTDSPAPAGALVRIRARATGELVYDADLRAHERLVPGQGDLVQRLSRVQQALEALDALHAAGRAHGDLRPAHVWTGATSRLSYLGKEVDPSQLLRARLRAGADPGDVDFAAPEILAGGSATVASDVFSAGALVHAAILGRAPHGRPNLMRPLEPALARLDMLVLRALDSDPSQRPKIQELTSVLGEIVVGLATQPANAAGPKISLVAPGTTEALARPPVSSGSPLILTCLLAVGGFFLVGGALWLAAVSFTVLGDVGRFALLFTLSSAVAALGFVLERKGFLRSGFALLTIVTQLVWANGAYLVVELHSAEKLGAWLMLALVVTALTEAFALARGSAVLATLGAIDTIIACALLGAMNRTDSLEGPAIWCATTAVILAGTALLGHRRAGLRLGLPPALATTILVFGSWVAALGIFGQNLFNQANERAQAFATIWPYFLGAGCALASAGLTRLGTKSYATLALLMTGVVAMLTPTIEALANSSGLGHRYVATILGGCLVVAAFHLPRLARDSGPQLIAVFAGLVSLLVAPVFAAFTALGGRGTPGAADASVWQLFDPALTLDDRLHHPLFPLAYVCGTCGVLVGLGLLFAREDEPRKAPYRALEVAGLLAFFFTLTILSLLRWDEYLYPAVLFGGGLAALAVGAWRRHVLLVVLPALALVVNAWIQYFAKIDAPLAFLLMGFGVGLLVGGVLFERKIKPFLPALRTWA